MVAIDQRKLTSYPNGCDASSLILRILPLWGWATHRRREPKGRFCKAAGVGYINPHSIRHLFATKALNEGIRVEIVSRILGHSSVDLTLKIYAHLLTETIQREYDKLWNISRLS